MKIQPFLSLVALLIPLAGTAKDQAADLLNATGTPAGLCVHVGCGDGSLTVAFAKNSRLLIQGLAGSEAEADAARASVLASKHHGRVSIITADFTHLPYPKNFITLLVADRFDQLIEKGLTLAEVVRVLAPNGHACLKATSGRPALSETDGFQWVEGPGDWVLLTKPRPKGFDDYTHYNYSADLNRVSKDQFAGPPGRVLWMAGPHWTCSPSGPVTQLSAGSRVISLINETYRFGSKSQSSRTFLNVRDAFNGVRYWKKLAPSGDKLTTIASASRIYGRFAPDGGMAALDALTGKVAETYKMLGKADWALLSNNVLVVSTARQVSGFEAQGGKSLWTKQIAVRGAKVSPNAAIDGDTLYYFSLPKKGKGKTVLGCLDLKTGEEKWSQDVSRHLKGKMGKGALSAYKNGVLVISDWGKGNGTTGGVHGFNAKDGTHLWYHSYRLVTSGRPARHKGSTFTDGYFIDGLYWYCDGNGNDKDKDKDKNKNSKGQRRANGWFGIDPKTGQVAKKLLLKPEEYIGDSCHRSQATVNYFMAGHTDFVDRRSERFAPRSRGLHNGCGFGMLPANGLMYTGSFYLDPFLQGELGTTLAQKMVPDALDAPGRLVKGPAFGVKTGTAATASDWPCLRANASRNSKSSAKVPANLKERWSVKLGERLSPPTVVGDTIYLSDVDGLRIVAVSAADGGVKWEFPLGGRAYVPPFYAQGLLLAGCADGWAYCLKADDGKLVWKYRAAPKATRMVERQRVASVWPIDSGVLVKENTVFCVAGRHPKLDSGAFVYALDLYSGAVKWHTQNMVGPEVHMLVSKGGQLSFGGSKGTYSAKDGKSGRDLELPLGAYDIRKIAVSYAITDKGACKKIWDTARVRALAATGDGVYTAGSPPDKIKPFRPYTALDIPHNNLAITTGVLHSFGTDGALRQALPLDSMPVFDGLVAAGEKLYLTTQDGKLRCYGN